jgi:hypothetical protein
MSEYPAETLCAVEGCGHKYSDHEILLHGGKVPNCCLICATNAERGFAVDDMHEFVPRKLAGGALTPSQEMEAYRKAMETK